MHEVMGVTLRAMQNDVARLERVSANLANALTPGYKRELMVQRADAGAATSSSATFTKALEHQTAAATAHGEPQSAPATQVLRDARNGTLRATGQSLDLALSGRGFFEVQMPDGVAYTRHGQFELDARGRLVTPQGRPVMGQSGEISLAPGAVSIDAGGALSQAGHIVAQLKIVDFDNTAQMQPMDGSLFAAGMGPTVLNGNDVQVRQGFLENANVNSMHEMVELMQAMRHFESIHRVIQSYDEMLGSAVRKLGDL